MNKLLLGTLMFFLMISSYDAISKIRIGSEVYYKNYLRVVEFIGKGGRIILAEDSNKRAVVTNVKEVHQLMRCLTDNLCTGHKILVNGTVYEILYSYDHYLVCSGGGGLYKTTVDLKNVTRLYTEKGGYKAGEEVYYINGGETVVVEYIFYTELSAMEDEKWLKIEEYPHYVKAKDVLKTQRCYKNYCINDKVIHGDTIRTIKLASASGRLILGRDRFSSYETLVDSYDVTMYKKCTSSCEVFAESSSDENESSNNWDNDSTGYEWYMSN